MSDPKKPDFSRAGRKIESTEQPAGNGEAVPVPEEQPQQDADGREHVGLHNIVPVAIRMAETGITQRAALIQNQIALSQQNNEIIRLLRVIAREDIPVDPPEATGDGG